MSPEQDPILRGLASISRTNRLLVRATVTLYVFGAITCGISFYLLNERAEDTRALVREEEADRVENRARFKRSDVLLCREIEALKRQNRVNAQESYDNLDRTLRIFRIERTPQVEAVALESLISDLLRNKMRPDGCGDLPSVGAGG